MAHVVAEASEAGLPPSSGQIGAAHAGSVTLPEARSPEFVAWAPVAAVECPRPGPMIPPWGSSTGGKTLLSEEQTGMPRDEKALRGVAEVRYRMVNVIGRFQVTGDRTWLALCLRISRLAKRFAACKCPYVVCNHASRRLVSRYRQTPGRSDGRSRFRCSGGPRLAHASSARARGRLVQVLGQPEGVRRSGFLCRACLD